jgi:hypothetical protein
MPCRVKRACLQFCFRMRAVLLLLSHRPFAQNWPHTRLLLVLFDPVTPGTSAPAQATRTNMSVIHLVFRLTMCSLFRLTRIGPFFGSFRRNVQFLGLGLGGA